MRLATQGAEPVSPDGTEITRKAQKISAIETKSADEKQSAKPTAIERVLDQRAALNFVDLPLKDVAASLAKQFKINVVLDHKILAEAKTSESLPISFAMKDVSLRHGLRWLLRQHDLDFYSPADHVLLITTADATKNAIAVHGYHVEDLIAPRIDGDNSDGPNSNSENSASDCPIELITLLTSCIEPASWDTAGGPGSISYRQGVLTVAQSESVQDQTARLLAALQRARRSPEAKLPIAVGDPESLRAEAAINARLASHQEVHLKEMNLAGLRDWLTAQGLPAVIDLRAVTEANATEVVFPTIDRSHERLGVALNWLLQQRDMIYDVSGEMLVITTKDRLRSAAHTIVYPVGDLKDTSLDPTTDVDTAPDYDGLIDAIISNIRSSSWENTVGTGSIAALPSARVLVCRQTAEIQHQVAQLLAELRARAPVSTEPEKKSAHEANSAIVHVYFLAQADADNRDAASAIAAAKNAQTKAAPTKGAVGKSAPTKQAAAKDSRADRYVAVISALIEPKSWTDGSGYIAAVPGAIVVRQTPVVQKQIVKLLTDLGALPGSAAHDRRRPGSESCGSLPSSRLDQLGGLGATLGGGGAISGRAR